MEYVEVPGPVEVLEPPAALLAPCVKEGETPADAGLVWEGMTWGDMANAVNHLWHGRLAQCDEQVRQLRLFYQNARPEPSETQ
nr:hypothetical protein 15 [Pseudomonadaceae bacterium]